MKEAMTKRMLKGASMLELNRYVGKKVPCINFSSDLENMERKWEKRGAEAIMEMWRVMIIIIGTCVGVGRTPRPVGVILIQSTRPTMGKTE